MTYPRIDHCAFGQMTINGKTFSSDLIIDTNGNVRDNWRRRQGHNLVPEDLGAIIDGTPEKLIIGTGVSGRMSVAESVREECRALGISIEAYPTAEAAQKFNEAAETGALVAAGFHLTC
ncbi:hypothetical protein HNR65_001683 [Desulfosalsimonas propionicica]|uniref:Uncharacterized protein n=1 Tax=Desulfosalsimonas propionicica TaxID=332175 RepID=A0A7W0C8Z5_9BACT|nr:MTH938/NDUFAF3 family protein [Desulfosalsimonas propionicica]MBA2881356.1 hypothetical protein [Desulfosalsimonas propionicica]